MNWINKVQHALEYIEENLLESLDIDSVCTAINYAPSSFQNLFSAITGYSISEYIRFRRLSCAADELESTDISITDAAFKYGYETVEAFSKAFKRLYGCSPSKYSKSNSGYQKFNSIAINYRITGGFCMERNFIPNLKRVDWSDTKRQNEYVNSVISALNALGENLSYDYICAVSGSAFRTSFSMPSVNKWNHGNYHVIHTPIIIEHTFKMLGYKVSHHIRSEYDYDERLIIDSIDKGIPVITLEGVINCADSCVISGYDNDGKVLMGYSPFMDISDDHNESHDTTGYFRKTGWHDGFCAKDSKVRILINEGKGENLSREEILHETMQLVKRLITTENIAQGQYNGLAAHKAFVNALQTYEWNDNFEPYLNVLCNQKQYIDRQYAVNFLNDNGRSDLANIYEQITKLTHKMAQQIPQDFSAGDMFSDKNKLKPYCDSVLEICELEEKAASLI